MKKLIFILILTSVHFLVSAQKKVMSADSSLIGRYYVGYVQSTGCDNSLNIHFNNSFRAAGDIQWNIGNHFLLRSFGVTEIQSGLKMKSFGTSYIGFTSKYFDVNAGFLASQFTFNFRPYPLSSGSQAEFGSQSMTTGAGTGISMNLKFNTVKIGFSANEINNTIEYQSVVTFKTNKAGFMYSDDKLGGAYRYTSKKLDVYLIDFVTRKDNINHFGFSTFWNFKKDLFLFNDVVVIDKDFDWLEAGIGKNVKINDLKFLIYVSGLYSDNINTPNQMRIVLEVTL